MGFPRKIPEEAIKDVDFRSRPVDPDLADAYFQQRSSFAGDKLRSMTRQRNGACVLFGISATAIGLMAWALASLAPLKSVEPMVFTVDRATGVVDRTTDLEGSSITEIAAVNRFFADRYVHARESYVWEEINTYADEVKSLSSLPEGQRYAAAMKSSSGPPAVYGRGTVVRVVTKSIFLLSDPKVEDKDGIMQVRFDRFEAKPGDDATFVWDDRRGCISPKPTSVCQTWSARFYFKRVKELPESIRRKNPLGWVVTSYEVRPDSQ